MTPRAIEPHTSLRSSKLTISKEAWELLVAQVTRIETKVDQLNGVGGKVKWLMGIVGAMFVAMLVAFIKVNGAG